MSNLIRKVFVGSAVVMLAVLLAGTFAFRGGQSPALSKGSAKAELLPLNDEDRLQFPKPVSTPAPQPAARDPLEPISSAGDVDERANWRR